MTYGRHINDCILHPQFLWLLGNYDVTYEVIAGKFRASTEKIGHWIRNCLFRFLSTPAWTPRILFDDVLTSAYICTCECHICTSKNLALLIIQHPLPNDSLIIRKRSSRVYAYGNSMRARMESWTLTSKNSAKLSSREVCRRAHVLLVGELYNAVLSI